MKLKTLAMLAVGVLGVSSLAFAGTNNSLNKMLADDSASQSAQPATGGDNSSGSTPSDNSNVGSSTQDTQMPPSSDESTGGSDTGTGDDDY